MPHGDLRPMTNERPKTRGDCEHGDRPCPWISCRYHLSTDTVPTQTGQNDTLWLNDGKRTQRIGARESQSRFLEVIQNWELCEGETCALDIADAGEKTLEEVAKLWNMTRERVRQVEMRAMRKIRREAPGLASLFDALAAERDARERGRE